MTTTPKKERRSRAHSGCKLISKKDGRFIARWLDPIDGKPREQSLTALGLTTHAARKSWCMKKAAAVKTTQQSVKIGLAAPGRASLATTVADYLERFTNDGTKSNKAIALHSFTAWANGVGVHDCQDLVPLHLTHWRERHYRASTSKLALSTRNRWTVVVSVFCNWLRSQGYAPMLSGDAVKTGLRRERLADDAIEILRPAEIGKLLEACKRYDDAGCEKPKTEPFVLLGLLTGMRAAELLGLAWAEIDLAGGEIRLPASRTKTKRARTIDLRVSPTAIRLLEALRLTTPGDLVFPEWTQGRINWFVPKLREDFGAPSFSMHTLRKTCGTLLTCSPSIFGAASAFLSAKRLGHAVDIAERHYLGVLTIDAAHRTIEAAGGFEKHADAIVARIGGVAPVDGEQATG